MTTNHGSTKRPDSQLVKCKYCENVVVEPVTICDRLYCRQLQGRENLAASIEADYAGWMHNLNVPTRFIGIELKSFPGNIVKRIMDIAWSESLFLYGPTGTTKTSLGFAAAMEWIKRVPPKLINPDKPFYGMKGIWQRVRSCDMMREVKRCYRSARDDSDAVIHHYENIPMLTIDDIFGGHMETEHDEAMLTAVLDARYEWCRPTIVTSNLSVADVRAMDSRLASRLGGYVKFRMSGEDRREYERHGKVKV